MLHATRIGMKLFIPKDNSFVQYNIVDDDLHTVNQQQYGLPVGKSLRYADGARLIHHHDGYALMRNWRIGNEVYDRIALPWENLVLAVE